MPPNEQATAALISLVQQFVELVRRLEPNWEIAYFRFRFEPTAYESNGSYASGSKITLIDPFKNGGAMSTMNKTAADIFRQLGKERGVLLVVVDSKLKYDVKFDYEQLERWKITKLYGASGVPEGL